MNDLDQRTADLAAFANASGQPNQPSPGGHSLVRPTSGISERVIGAQPVAVYRDEAKIFTKLKALAAAAGSDWFYRFPVKKREGGQDWVEGASIKLANDVARIFGNCVIEVRELDVGDAWTFYSRLTDIETGFSMERAYRQRKSQSSMRTRDADRQLDIAYQIGQSKAIRNVITNGLQLYCDFAFEEARNSLVDKIGKDLAGWRERTLQGIKNMGVELARVERQIGRAAKDWLAPDVARVIAQMKAVADGMANVDEVFPQITAEASGAPAQSPPPTDDAGGDQASAEAADRHPGPGDSPGAPAEGLELAYRRGVEAKTAGHQRKAIPGEYRDVAHEAEVTAWLAGFDGKPFPEDLK